MKIYWSKAAWMVVATPLLFTACSKKDNGALDGPAPQPTFTITTQQVGFTTVATFTNTTPAYSGPGIVFYEWDFGDGTVVPATTTTVSHTYTSGGTKQAQLLASARGGNGFSPKQDIVVPDAAAVVKQLLTGGTSKTWKLDAAAVATITVGPNDGDVKSYYAGGPANSLPTCQSDDEFTFSNANVYTYNAMAQTFVAGATGGCMAPRSGTSNFTFGPTTSGLAQFVFATPGTFIGVTDAPDLTYRIMSITATNMVLRAGAANANLVFEMKLIAK